MDIEVCTDLLEDMLRISNLTKAPNTVEADKK